MIGGISLPATDSTDEKASDKLLHVRRMGACQGGTGTCTCLDQRSRAIATRAGGVAPQALVLQQRRRVRRQACARDPKIAF